MRVVHCFAVELRTMFCRTFAALGKRSVVALAIVEMMIDVTVEMFRPVIPRSRSEEYAA
jgi:hypothetical protein